MCLDNGACTCAESTCNINCISCAHLTKSSICDEMQESNRFGMNSMRSCRSQLPASILRSCRPAHVCCSHNIHTAVPVIKPPFYRKPTTSESTRTVKIDDAEYTVLRMEIRDWLNASIVPKIDDRRPIFLWIRSRCNVMVNWHLNSLMEPYRLYW